MPALFNGGICLGFFALGLNYGPDVHTGVVGLGGDRWSRPEADEEKRERQDDRPPDPLVGNVKNR
jgi:hypothetical protein